MSYDFKTIQDHFIETFGERLSKKLSYHNLDHVLDVVQQSLRIGAEEEVDEESLYLLAIAALYHDSGFITIYKGHEEVGCILAREHLPQFNITEEQLNRICGMIMATKVPQQPHTLLEKIICDADLDYLGRKDFFPISERLFQELMNYGFVSNRKEWDEIQTNFFREHRYFTLSNARARNQGKAEHLAMIRKRLASSSPL